MSLKLGEYRIDPERPRGAALRIGAVRYLPRGVTREERRRYFDVWMPALSPAAELLKAVQAAPDGKQKDAAWKALVAGYRKQIAGDAAARQTIALIAAMAERAPVEIGCYCNVPTCHRFTLERLIREAAEA
ncbi:MAG: DUF488 family protein [Reyranellaceae bacterium]